MNRKIQFRGMLINMGWVYGLLSDTGGNCYISNSIGMPLAYDVQRETIGQFIGLLDRNGKEIYEGDIIEMNGNAVLIESMEDIHHAMGWRDHKENKNCSDSQRTIQKFEKSCKIIGNIFENPSLLK